MVTVTVISEASSLGSSGNTLYNVAISHLRLH